MSVVKKPDLVSIEEYLATEADSPIKHEYLAGVVYAMAGANNRHNDTVLNCLISLGNQLKGQRCRPSNSDTKVRINLPGVTRFYYPDALVACDRSGDDASYQEHPVVILEVLSESTRRIDTSEKLEAYLKIPSMRVYLIAEQDKPAVQVYRRKEANAEIVEEYYATLAETIPLPEIEASLPLADLYDRIDFGPGSD